MKLFTRVYLTALIVIGAGGAGRAVENGMPDLQRAAEDARGVLAAGAAAPAPKTPRLAAGAVAATTPPWILDRAGLVDGRVKSCARGIFKAVAAMRETENAAIIGEAVQDLPAWLANSSVYLVSVEEMYWEEPFAGATMSAVTTPSAMSMRAR